jgi:hypothetical protein
VSAVIPVVTQAAVGAGHWASARRQRALAAWASAAGFGLVAWGLGAEAPARAEAQKHLEQQKDLLRERGIEVPATATGTQTWMARQPRWNALSAFASSVKLVLGVRSGLRHPRRLTALAMAGEAPMAVVLCPAGAPGRAAAQAEDRRRLSPGRSRSGSPAAGSIG